MTYQVGEPYPLLEGDTDEGDEAATNALVRCLLVLTPAISRTVPRRRPRPLRIRLGADLGIICHGGGSTATNSCSKGLTLSAGPDRKA